MSMVCDKLTIGYGAFPPDGEPYTALAGKREDIVELLEEVLNLQRKRNQHEVGFTITMPCGHEQAFRELDDIPLENLRCPCSKAERFMIKLLQY